MVRSSLRSLLIEAATFRLSATVVRQLVGYYGDWRRSRDVLPDMLDATYPARAPRLFQRAAQTNFSQTIPRP